MVAGGAQKDPFTDSRRNRSTPNQQKKVEWKTNILKRLCRGCLNTLAQNGTALQSQPAIIVNGKGSDLKDIKVLKSKAKRKLVSQKMVLSLIDVPKKRGTKKRLQSYWNTFHCQNKIVTVNGRLHGKYCKNRCCTLCAAIRKAEIINKYLPVLQQWEQPYFLTLTVKSVPYNRLRAVMESMQKEFREIVAMYRKRQQRGTGKKLIGVHSLECNFNPLLKIYNPHFHVIVPNAIMGYQILGQWFQRRRSYEWVGCWGQDIRPITDPLKTMIEIVKYGSKIFTEPDVKKKSKTKGNGIDRNIYVAALDNIFKAMKGFRIFDRFGFNLPIEATKKENFAALVSGYEDWTYIPQIFDWYNANTGERLTKYQPLFSLLYLMEMNVDCERE